MSETKAGPTPPSRASSGETREATQRREGFYEFTNKMLERELASIGEALLASRRAVSAERRRADEAEEAKAEWKALALKYGTMTDAEKRNEIGTLQGLVMVSRDVVLYSHADAIEFACIDLAKKMKRAATPTTPETR